MLGEVAELDDASNAVVALIDAGQLDEGFFRRYRELLDAEDAAFDELEHAYEDGDRAHWADDLAAWRKIVEKRCAFLEREGLTTVAASA